MSFQGIYGHTYKCTHEIQTVQFCSDSHLFLVHHFDRSFSSWTVGPLLRQQVHNETGPAQHNQKSQHCGVYERAIREEANEKTCGTSMTSLRTKRTWTPLFRKATNKHGYMTPKKSWSGSRGPGYSSEEKRFNINCLLSLVHAVRTWVESISRQEGRALALRRNDQTNGLSRPFSTFWILQQSTPGACNSVTVALTGWTVRTTWQTCVWCHEGAVVPTG